MSETPPARRRRYAAEFVLIVVSILVAFALDRAYENNRERGEERVVLLGLRGDFEANRDQLENYLRRYQLRFEVAVSVIEALDPRRPTLTPDSARFLVSQLHGGGTFDPRSATLDQIESSGRADLLRDGELRTLIAQWRVHADDALNQQSMVVRFTDAQLWPAIASVGIGPSPAQRIGQSLPPWSTPPPPVATVRARIEPLARQQAYLITVVREDLEEVLAATNDVLARLEELTGG